MHAWTSQGGGGMKAALLQQHFTVQRRRVNVSVAWAGGFYAANWADNARNRQVLPSYVTHYDVVGVGPEGAHWTAVLLLKIQVFLLDVQVQMSAVFF